MTSAIHSVPFIDEYTDYILARIEALMVPPPQYSEVRPRGHERCTLGSCQNIRAFVEDQYGSECYNVASVSDKDSSLSFCLDCWQYIQGEE